jgi:hypothetical protein
MSFEQPRALWCVRDREGRYHFVPGREQITTEERENIRRYHGLVLCGRIKLKKGPTPLTPADIVKQLMQGTYQP